MSLVSMSAGNDLLIWVVFSVVSPIWIVFELPSGCGLIDSRCSIFSNFSSCRAYIFGFMSSRGSTRLIILALGGTPFFLLPFLSSFKGLRLAL